MIAIIARIFEIWFILSIVPAFVVGYLLRLQSEPERALDAQEALVQAALPHRI